jgi:hypothetical protein
VGEKLDLIADQETDQIDHPEATDYPAGPVPRLSCMLEGAIQFLARDFDSHRSILAQEPIEPVQRSIERTAEVQKKSREHLREPPSLPAVACSL